MARKQAHDVTLKCSPPHLFCIVVLEAHDFSGPSSGSVGDLGSSCREQQACEYNHLDASGTAHTQPSTGETDWGPTVFSIEHNGVVAFLVVFFFSLASSRSSLALNTENSNTLRTTRELTLGLDVAMLTREKLPRRCHFSNRNNTSFPDDTFFFFLSTYVLEE